MGGPSLPLLQEAWPDLEPRAHAAPWPCAGRVVGFFLLGLSSFCALLSVWGPRYRRGCGPLQQGPFFDLLCDFLFLFLSASTVSAPLEPAALSTLLESWGPWRWKVQATGGVLGEGRRAQGTWLGMNFAPLTIPSKHVQSQWREHIQMAGLGALIPLQVRTATLCARLCPQHLWVPWGGWEWNETPPGAHSPVEEISTVTSVQGTRPVLQRDLK